MGKVSRKAASLSKPGDRWRISRRLTEVEQNLVAPHNQHVGDVIHAYNSAHAGLFVLFWRLCADENYKLAISMWHVGKSDRSQRELLEAFISNTTSINKTYKRNILWASSALGKLSTFRNDAAHSDMIWYYDKLIPGLATKPSTQERLDSLPLEKHWRKLRGDLIALSSYLTMLDLSLSGNEPFPLSQRPRLLLARSTTETTRKRRRQNKKAKSERQRQASRA